MSGIHPALLAAMDQERVGLEAHLDFLIEVYRRCVAAHGTAQGEADFVVYLPEKFSALDLSGLLMTAVARLVAADGAR